MSTVIFGHQIKKFVRCLLRNVQKLSLWLDISGKLCSKGVPALLAPFATQFLWIASHLMSKLSQIGSRHKLRRDSLPYSTSWSDFLPRKKIDATLQAKKVWFLRLLTGNTRNFWLLSVEFQENFLALGGNGGSGRFCGWLHLKRMMTSRTFYRLVKCGEFIWRDGTRWLEQSNRIWVQLKSHRRWSSKHWNISTCNLQFNAKKAIRCRLKLSLLPWGSYQWSWSDSFFLVLLLPDCSPDCDPIQ